MGLTPASLSVKMLKRAVELAEQIEKLQSELNSILEGAGIGAPRRGRPPGSGAAAAVAAAPAEKVVKTRKKPRFSAAARASIAAAQRARWAKIRKEKAQQGK